MFNVLKVFFVVGLFWGVGFDVGSAMATCTPEKPQPSADCEAKWSPGGSQGGCYWDCPDTSGCNPSEHSYWYTSRGGNCNTKYILVDCTSVTVYDDKLKCCPSGACVSTDDYNQDNFRDGCR